MRMQLRLPTLAERQLRTQREVAHRYASSCFLHVAMLDVRNQPNLGCSLARLVIPRRAGCVPYLPRDDALSRHNAMCRPYDGTVLFATAHSRILGLPLARGTYHLRSSSKR